MTIKQSDYTGDTDLDQFVVTQMPHFVAVHYQRMLEAQTWEERITEALRVFELGLRALALAVVSQYLFRDLGKVSDPTLNHVLENKLRWATLNTWKEILFRTLRAYESARDLFFVPELYDFYWNTSREPHLPRENVEAPFDELLLYHNELSSDPALARILPSQLPERFNRIATLLRGILEQFRFMGKYELIKVLESTDEGYAYEHYTGRVVELASDVLRTSEELQPGFFYLLNKYDGTTLLLYPMVIFWQVREMASALGVDDTEAAIYERLMPTSVRYLLPILYEYQDNSELLTEFVRQVMIAIKQVEVERREVRRLSWPLLQEVTRVITYQQMGEMRRKYNPALFLQRDRAKAAFDDFLASDKTCFVLIGQSGVGKSNFLLSMLDELQAKQPDVCVLVYDGANLPSAKPLSQTLNDDFQRYLKFKGLGGEEEAFDVLYETARIDGIDSRVLLLMVDAINENTQAHELLRHIDALVREHELRWLKVVVTSRPEAWRAMKRGLHLTEHKYYREKDQDQIGVELERFTYREEGEVSRAEDRAPRRPGEREEPWIEMEPFTRQELPKVYEKYKQVFQLQTEYSTLTPEVKRALQDPLILRLVAEMAETHEGRKIPETITVTDIYRHYVDYLVDTGRLKLEDVKFLEGELVPWMIGDDHYAKSITAAQVLGDDRLFHLIHNEGTDTTGRKINQSYANLVDAGILVQQGAGTSYEITFRYERFYDYFAGQRIFALSETQVDRHAFFLAMITRTTKFPFLWGAVKNALVQEAKNHGPETLLKLCSTDQQRVKEMMVSALDDLGRDNRDQVQVILKTLMPQEAQPTGLQRVWRLVRKPVVADDVRARNAKKIAIEVASDPDLSISWVLRTATLHGDPAVRADAVRYSYHLWEHDPNAGFEVLEHLAKSVIHGLIPDFAAIESVLGLSLIIFFDHPRDRLVLLKLQSIWHEIIGKVLGVQESGSRLGRKVREFIREQLISFVVAHVFRLFREMPAYTVVNYPDFEAFFRSGDTDRALYRNLTQYLDPQGSYSREQMEQDFLSVVKIRSLLIGGVAVMGLSAHMAQDPLAFLPFLKKLFEEAKKDLQPNPYISAVPQILTAVLDHHPELDEVYDFFVHTVEVTQQYYAKHPRIPGLNQVFQAPEASYFGPYMLYEFQRIGAINKTDWLGTRINAALARNDIAFFDFLIKTELPLVAIECRRPHIALDALALFFNRRSAEISPLIQSFLSRLRVYYPDEVDDFLEEQQASEEFRLQVRTNEPIETVGELIGIRSWLFFRDDVIVGSPALRDRLIRALAKAADYDNPRAWVDYAFREVINLIYGSEVLRQAK